MTTRLFPCGACARHVRASEAACPFCGAALTTPAMAPVVRRGLSRGHAFALGAALAVSACTPAADPHDDGTTSGGETGTDVDARQQTPTDATPTPEPSPSDTAPPPDDPDPAPVAAYGAPAPTSP